VDDILLSNTRARYDFDRLSSDAADRSAPPIGPFTLSADNLSDIAFIRRRPDPTGGNRYMDIYRTSNGAYVLVTIQQTRDSQAAHESLLQFLANSMAERLPTAQQRGVNVGETAFANLANPATSIAFVRRNVFVKIALADPAAAVDLAKIAHAIDQQIVAAPARP
jgi:hypothetical protein